MMARQYLPSLLITLLVFMLSACQSEPKAPEQKREVLSMPAPENIIVQYYLRYSKEEEQLKAEASFFTGNDNKNRKPKTFNDVRLGRLEMRLDETSKENPYYKVQQRNVSQKKLAFQFLSDQGTQETDFVEIPEMTSLSLGKTLSKSKGGKLSWEGTPLGDKESLVVLFTNEKEHTTSIIINGPTTKSEVIIPKKKTQKIGLGKNRVYVVRKNKTIATKNGKNGIPRESRALTEYYSETIEVVITD